MRWIFLQMCIFCTTAITFAGGLSCFAGESNKGNTTGTTKNVLKIDDLYPVYGTCGSRRHATFVAGEKMHFAAKISGIGELSEPGSSLLVVYHLLNSSGQIVNMADDCIQKRHLPLGGDATTYHFSRDTEMSTPPGRYSVRIQIVDPIRKQLAEKTFEVNVLGKVGFCILGACLTADKEVRYPATGNTTLGQGVYVIHGIQVPKNKNDEVNAEVSMTVFDRNNSVVFRDPKPATLLRKGENVGEHGLVAYSRQYFRIPETGFYRIHFEAKDLSTNEIDQCDLPLVVHALPGMPQTAAEPAATESQTNVQRNGTLQPDGGMNKLLMDAWPTYGGFGSPRDNTFISGEQMFFGLSFNGVSGNADREMDGDIELILLDSNSSERPNEKEKVAQASMKRFLLSSKHSLIDAYKHKSNLPPGRYTGRFVVNDNIANKAASKDVPITIIANDTFALSRVGLTKDKEREIWAGSNLTVGDSIFAGGEIYLPKTSSGHDVEVTASFLDANRKELTRMIPFREKNVISPASYPYEPLTPKFSQPFTPNRPGSYFVRLELKDMTTQETVTKELPFNVFSPPELPETTKVSKSATNAASSFR